MAAEKSRSAASSRTIAFQDACPASSAQKGGAVPGSKGDASLSARECDSPMPGASGVRDSGAGAAHACAGPGGCSGSAARRDAATSGAPSRRSSWSSRHGRGRSVGRGRPVVRRKRSRTDERSSSSMPKDSRNRTMSSTSVPQDNVLDEFSRIGAVNRSNSHACSAFRAYSFIPPPSPAVEGLRPALLLLLLLRRLVLRLPEEFDGPFERFAGEGRPVQMRYHGGVPLHGLPFGEEPVGFPAPGREPVALMDGRIGRPPIHSAPQGAALPRRVRGRLR